MKTVSASEAKAKLLGLLDEVERGESVVVTRHGRAVARLVPEEDAEHAKRRATMQKLDEIRRRMPAMSVEEILSAIKDGRKY